MLLLSRGHCKVIHLSWDKGFWLKAGFFWSEESGCWWGHAIDFCFWLRTLLPLSMIGPSYSSLSQQFFSMFPLDDLSSSYHSESISGRSFHCCQHSSSVHVQYISIFSSWSVCWLLQCSPSFGFPHCLCMLASIFSISSLSICVWTHPGSAHLLQYKGMPQYW